MIRSQIRYRRVEAFLMVLVWVIAALGFWLVSAAQRVQAGQDPMGGLPADLLPLIPVVVFMIAIHVILNVRHSQADQIFLPLASLIFCLGLTMVWRLSGSSGVWQQLTRGYIPGMIVMGVFVARPRWIDYVRRWTVPIAVFGLLLAFATGLFGQLDETGARLSLKLGPLPAVQTSEIIKIVLIIFLAWFIDREGEEVEGRARVLFGFLRVPALRYFIPGVLFVTLATLALVRMGDFGAVPILGAIFVLMLFSGFDTRTFATIAAIGLAMAIFVGLVLALTWHVPAHIEYRILAFQNPWSTAQVGTSGVTISEGPGYQIQQAIYATIAGGLTGSGLGYGSPGNIPLVSTDFIYAAVLEEMGAIVGIAILVFYIILILRMLRSAMLLPGTLLFERLLLAGIATHFFTQVFIMVGGTLNLIPMTGVTLPLLSLGGSALLTNLFELGLVMAIAQRLEV